jgi:hypothetical protein
MSHKLQLKVIDAFNEFLKEWEHGTHSLFAKIYTDEDVLEAVRRIICSFDK